MQDVNDQISPTWNHLHHYIPCPLPLPAYQIGVGTGANLEFYPPGSRLYCVDPNPAFEVYFRRECQQKAAHLHPDIQIVPERGESMPSVGDGSMDAVVMTKVLCSVTHVDQVLGEIRRVLAPVRMKRVMFLG